MLSQLFWLFVSGSPSNKFIMQIKLFPLYTPTIGLTLLNLIFLPRLSIPLPNSILINLKTLHIMPEYAPLVCVLLANVHLASLDYRLSVSRNVPVICIWLNLLTNCSGTHPSGSCLSGICPSGICPCQICKCSFGLNITLYSALA